MRYLLVREAAFLLPDDFRGSRADALRLMADYDEQAPPSVVAPDQSLSAVESLEGAVASGRRLAGCAFVFESRPGGRPARLTDPDGRPLAEPREPDPDFPPSETAARLGCLGRFGFGGGFLAARGVRAGTDGQSFCSSRCRVRSECWERHKQAVREASRADAEEFEGLTLLFGDGRQAASAWAKARGRPDPFVGAVFDNARRGAERGAE